MSFTCADAEPLLPLVTDGALDERSEPGLFAHLAGCAHCQHLLAQHDLIAVTMERASRERPLRRRPLLRLWHLGAGLATAAGLALAIGLTWPDRLAPPVTNATAVTSSSEAAPRIRAVTRPDGRTVYLVFRDGSAFLVDPLEADTGRQEVPSDGQIPVGWRLGGR